MRLKILQSCYPFLPSSTWNWTGVLFCIIVLCILKYLFIFQLYITTALYVGEVDYVIEGPIGAGDGINIGDAWSDHDLYSNGYITAIELNTYYAWSCCWLVTAIRTRYGNVWSNWHGQAIDTQEMFELNDGAVIETVKGGAGYYIDSMQFITSDDITYGPYGDESMEGGDPYQYSHPNCRLAYFTGRSGDWLDSLTFHFECAGMNYF